MSRKTPEHITITDKPGDRKDVSCSQCGTGMEVGGPVRSIAGADMIATFITQHRHGSKR